MDGHSWSAGDLGGGGGSHGAGLTSIQATVDVSVPDELVTVNEVPVDVGGNPTPRADPETALWSVTLCRGSVHGLDPQTGDRSRMHAVDR